jgi:glycine cleavage system aminomethyltransferase T
MRLEKGYRVWGSDLTSETTPYEAGLGFAVRLEKPGGFEGVDALRAMKANGIPRRLRALVLGDPSSAVLGSEPVRVGTDVVGRVTSGGVAYSSGASVAYAYLPVEHAAVGTEVQIDLFGTWLPARVTAEPLFDPSGERVHS